MVIKLLQLDRAFSVVVWILNSSPLFTGVSPLGDLEGPVKSGILGSRTIFGTIFFNKSGVLRVKGWYNHLVDEGRVWIFKLYNQFILADGFDA